MQIKVKKLLTFSDSIHVVSPK